jgi:elongation factor G
MLFYAGKTKTLGEVHHGTTITDFMEQERDRGITICSAAVTFNWKEHRINLLDTPGHIDFTMEVEQSLGAVDGCVVVLDSSAGVEAQTITVWNQSDRYELPKLVFANKMDRSDADFDGCVNDMKTKLEVQPVPLHCPVKIDGKFRGIVDLISMKQITWNLENQGQSYKVEDISDIKHAHKKRLEMIDILSGVDDQLAEIIIANDSLDNIDNNQILNSLRRQTIARKIVPMVLGSAYKNCGVQTLMDSIINYLPAPSDRNKVYDCFGSDFVGNVFKVTHDKQRGPLSLVRIFRGELRKNSKVSTSTGTAETVQRIYEPLADEYREVETIGAGNVAVCAGLKSTKTGDILVQSMSSLRSAQRKLQKTADDEDSVVFSLEPKIPDAVYFCSIEPPSIGFQQALDAALAQIQREDQSLRIKYDENTMQTVLGGMGQLHLEIIKSRLLSEYKIDADIGPLQIAYKETIETKSRGSFKIEKEIAGSKQNVEIELTLAPIRGPRDLNFKLDNSPEASEILTPIRPRFINIVRKSAISALDRGPKIGGQVENVRIILHKLVIGRGTVDSIIMAATSQCVQKVLLQADCRLMEPMMSIQIVVPEEKVSPVIADLGRRRAQILNISLRGEYNKVSNFI